MVTGLDHLTGIVDELPGQFGNMNQSLELFRGLPAVFTDRRSKLDKSAKVHHATYFTRHNVTNFQEIDQLPLFFALGGLFRNNEFFAFSISVQNAYLNFLTN